MIIKKEHPLRCWLDLKGQKQMPWSDRFEYPPVRDSHSDPEPGHNLPSPVHTCKDIKNARRYVHRLIKQEISQGNH